jgi:hypothetical protein
MFRSEYRSAYRASILSPKAPLTPSDKANPSLLATPSLPSTPSRASQLLSQSRSSSCRPRRRQSTPASLNKAFSRNDQILWVRNVDAHPGGEGATDDVDGTDSSLAAPLSSSAPSPSYVPRRHSTGVAPNRSVFLAAGMATNPDSSDLSQVLEFEDDELRRQFKREAVARLASPVSTSSRGTSKSGGVSRFQQHGEETSITAN